MSRITHTLLGLSLVSLTSIALSSACASSDTDGGGNDPTTTGSGTNVGGGFATGGGGEGTGGDPSTGAGGEDPFECGETMSSASLEKLPADLIVVVDNSQSMALEAFQVKAQMNTMVGAIAATGIDAHLILISKESNNTIFDLLETGVCIPAPLGSGSCPADEKLPGFRHVVQEVASHDALSQIIDTYDQWKGSLRANASRTFLVVSDDESAMSAAAFTTALGQLNPPITNFKFNAIVASQDGALNCGLCLITGCAQCTNPCCDKTLMCAPISETKGQQYIDLQTQTMGVYGDLCTQSFAPVFTDMATAVIQHTQISCSVDIPAPPNGTIVPTETNVDFIPTQLATAQPIYNVANSGSCTINGGWYFDNASNPTKIHLCPATCTLVKQSTEGQLRVKFGCKTQTTPS